MKYEKQAVINFTESDFSSLLGYSLMWNSRVEKDPNFPWVMLTETLAHLKSKAKRKESLQA